MAIVKQGSTTLNSGAKGDKGDAGTSGGTSPSVRVVTNQTELTTVLSGVEKELSIQADFTLSSDITIPDGAVISDGGGIITVNGYDITFVDNSFESPHKRTFLDFSYAPIVTDTLNAVGTEGDFLLTRTRSDIHGLFVKLNGTLIGDYSYQVEDKFYSFSGNTVTFYAKKTLAGDANTPLILTNGDVVTFEYVDADDMATINDGSTFSDGNIEISWFGLTPDGIEGIYLGAVQSGTDNRNVFMQAQKIYNYNGGYATLLRGGNYAFSVIEEPITASWEFTNLGLKNGASLLLGDNTKLLVLPTNIGKYEAITFYQNDYASLKGGELVGELINHDYSSNTMSEWCHGIVFRSRNSYCEVTTPSRNFSGDCLSFVPYGGVIYSSAYPEQGIQEYAFTSGAWGEGEKNNTINKTTGDIEASNDYHYSKLFDIDIAALDTTGEFMIYGYYGNAGQSGFTGNTIRIAFYDATANDTTKTDGFIEMTDDIDTYSSIPKKPDYKFMRLVIPTPYSWVDLNGSVFAIGLTTHSKISPKKLSYGVRQGISNITSYNDITGIHFDNNGRRFSGEFGSPGYHIDVEDFYQGLNNINIHNNTFGNAENGIVIFKGTKYLRFYNNTIPYATDPLFDGRVCSFSNAHEAMVYDNTFKGCNISIARRDKFYNNLIFDGDLTARLEREEVSNNIGYNIRHAIGVPEHAHNGPFFTTYKDNVWNYDKPLPLDINDSPMYFSGNEKRIFINETHDFRGFTHRYNLHNLFRVGGSSTAPTGYIDGFIIKALKPDTGYEASEAASFSNMNINRMVSSTNVHVQYGGVADRLFSNSNIEGWLLLELSSYPAENSGTFSKYTLKDTNLNIVDSATAGQYALRVGTVDVDFEMISGSIRIEIGDHANADNFLSLSNYGTKIFTGVTFYTDHSTPQTQTLDSSYEFIDCTFNNIAFTGAKILYTKANPNLEVFTDNASAIAGGIPTGYMYRTATGEVRMVYTP